MGAVGQRNPSRLRSLARSIWLPASLALPVCVALALLHFYQQRERDDAVEVIQAMGQASRDLSQGALHYTLHDLPGSSWQESTGNALLAQAVTSFDAASGRLEIDPGTAGKFREELARLRELLSQPRGETPAARREVELRLALFQVDSRAREIDRQLLADLQRRRAFFDWAFLAAFAAAFVLLAAVCLAVYRLQRRTLAAMGLLEAISAASPDVIFAKDPQGRYLLFNPAAMRVAGAEGDVRGRTDTDFFPPEQAASILAHDREVVERREILTFDEELTTAGVGLRTFLVTKGPLLDSDGEMFGTFGIARDISDRKASERAAADSRARLSSVIEGLDVGLVLISEDGNMVHWNRAAIAMHGFGSIDEVPREPAEFAERFELQTADGRVLQPEDWPVCRIRNGERLRNVELHVRRLDSNWQRVFSFGGAMVGDLQEQGQLAMVTIADVTPRHLAEESVRRLQRVEAIGTLAAGIAHDFNNLLMAIGGNARLALTLQEEGRGAQSELAEIERAAMRGSDLVRRILLYSRAEESSRRPTDLAALIEEALRLLRPTTPRMIAFSTHVAPDLPAVNADAAQIHQVLVNLVTNAVHAIEDGPRRGTGRIDIRLETLALDHPRDLGGEILAPGRYAQLSVRDDGCGMSQDTLSRIFDPFFTTRGPGRGTGLGLSVAHGIVHGHDGVILAESWPGEGTCMRVVLPAAAEAVEQEPAPGTADGNRPTEGKRILYVDDEESLVLLVGRWLGRYGHEVRGYTDAHSALRALQDGASFDLLVTDLAMPGMSGFDVAADALRLRPGLPVIMMSGYVTAADRARGLEMGIRELLLKPARIDELAAIIARHLDA